MNTSFESSIAEFVDRASEMKRFRELVFSRTKPIIFIAGDGGMGKSSLLARMVHECALAKVSKVSVTWSETHGYDYLAVMRKLRDDLGAPYFASFTELVNAYFDDRVQATITVNTSGNISVASGAIIRDSSVGSISGVTIRDCMFVVPRRDLGVSENERMLRLTKAFIADLQTFSSTNPLVMFFDAVEKMTPETRAWMWGEFMVPIREGAVRNLICVHSGRSMPELQRDMTRAMEITTLKPLLLDDIIEYLERRQVKSEALRDLAILLLAVTGGLPIEVANKVDVFEAMLTH